MRPRPASALALLALSLAAGAAAWALVYARKKRTERPAAVGARVYLKL